LRTGSRLGCTDSVLKHRLPELRAGSWMNNWSIALQRASIKEHPPSMDAVVLRVG
jgi:hypothetical protein